MSVFHYSQVCAFVVADPINKHAIVSHERLKVRISDSREWNRPRVSRKIIPVLTIWAHLIETLFVFCL